MTTVSMVSDVTDPVGDVMRFIRNFNEKYGAEHPTFYQGSYSQVWIKFIIISLFRRITYSAGMPAFQFLPLYFGQNQSRPDG